jgi:MFS family permease
VTPSIGEQFRKLGKPVRPIILATGLNFWQQITGINAVIYYVNLFLVNAGMSYDLANYMSIAVGAINVTMTVVSVVLIDRLGRKPLLLLSLGGMALMHGFIGAIALLLHSASLSGILCVVGAVLFIMSFAIGMGACPWAVINELFLSETRAIAVSLSLATNWATNLAVSLLFPILIAAVNMGWVFAGFSVLSVLAFVFLATLLPETKGRTVEDIVAGMSK